MKRRLTLVLALALMALAPCSSLDLAATSAGSAKPENTNSQRQDYQKQIQHKLRELDREIKDLKARAPQNENQLHEQFQREMAELEQKRQVARQKLEKLSDSTQRAWRDMKPGVDAAVKDLESACQRAAEDFKETK
ncbi:MAG TPA: hypothetical protein VFM21_03500 [Terriglobia bacterium]|nr:hypothetical protein [Terriglobia bacterium]